MSSSSEVYIIDDDAPTARALTSLLGTAGLMSRTYGGGIAFLRDCGHLPPGCVITRLERPGVDASEFIRRLNEQDAPYPAIIVASGGGVFQAVEAMKAGAADVIEAPYDDEVLLRSVCTVLTANARAFAHATSQRLKRKVLATLTPREHDVLNGVTDGKTNKMIARDFGISPRTVEVHRASLMMKAGARSVSELVRLAGHIEPRNSRP